MSNQTRVIILAVVTILVFVFGIYFLKGVNLFQRKHVYYAVYPRVDGLYKSNIVEVNGIRIGMVGEMYYRPATNDVLVELELKDEYQIPSNSTALIVSQDLLGGKAVSIRFGDGTTFLNEGDTLRTELELGLQEQLASVMNPLRDGLKSIVPTLDSALYNINYLFSKQNPKSLYYSIEKLNTALANIESASAELNGILKNSSGDLNKTFDNLNSITTNINNNNAHIENLLTNLSSFSDSLKEAQLKTAVANLNSAVVNLNGVVKEIKDGNGTLGKLVYDEALYTNLDKAVKDLDALLIDVKARPGRYINIQLFGKKKEEK